MIDVAEIDRLKKKLAEIRSQKSSLDIEIAKKEAIIADTKERLFKEFDVKSVEEGKEALRVLNSKAESIKQEVADLLEKASGILNSFNGA